MPFKKPAGGDRYRSFCGEFRFLSTDDAFNFHVEIWLLNDTTASVDAKTSVEVELDGKVYPMFTWEAHADAQRNAIGPSVNLKLPAASSGQLILRLRAGEYSSEYVLVYTASAPAQPSRFMNM